MDTMRKRLVVIGAGPMGLYAAFAAAQRNLEVTVLERDRIGESLLSWGSTRFFSPLEMNVPAWVRAALPGLPSGDALLTGPEMVERVLLPLSRHPLVNDKIRTRHRVRGIARAGLSREDFPAHPVRHEKAFRILVETREPFPAETAAGGAAPNVMPGGEYLLDADFVFDATGGYRLGNGMGSGGLMAPGESASGPAVIRRLGDMEAALQAMRGGRILLLGHGHSAAHALLALRDASQGNREVSVTWAFRSRNMRPFRETPDDPLPGRAAITAPANALAAAPPAFLDIRRGAALAALEKSGSRLKARFGAGDPVEVDAVFAFTGYRPDLSFLSELALDLAPATQGTRKLHALLSGAADCLSVPAPAAGDLESGEPGFFLLGAKSYGRSNTFLLRDGILQLEMILKHAVG